jgi:hypothetical protein
LFGVDKTSSGTLQSQKITENGEIVMSTFGYGEEQQQRGTPPLHSEKIVGDRKTFFLDLKENERGRFIKITEDVRGRRDTIMLPLEVAEEFADALDRLLEANKHLEN